MSSKEMETAPYNLFLRLRGVAACHLTPRKRVRERRRGSVLAPLGETDFGFPVRSADSKLGR